MNAYTKAYLNLAIGAPRRLQLLRGLTKPGEQPSDWRAARASGYDDQWMSVLTAGSIEEGRERKKVWTTMNGAYFKRQCFADECESAPRYVQQNKGWYTDGEDMNATARGVVARLPHGRFLSGYYWSENGEYVYTADVYDEERDAVIAADALAHRFGETESEYQTRWHEAGALRDEIEAQLKRLRECARLRHEECMEYVRAEVGPLIQSIRNNREVLATDYKDFEA